MDGPGRQVTATCACGQCAIVVDALPTMHGVCHCTNCKRRTGSAFGVSAYFDKSAVIGERGATQVYRFTHSSGQHEQERHFCGVCGTTLFWFVSTLPEKIGIAGGCFVGEAIGSPTYSVSDDQREPYVALPRQWQVWP